MRGCEIEIDGNKLSERHCHWRQRVAIIVTILKGVDLWDRFYCELGCPLYHQTAFQLATLKKCSKYTMTSDGQVIFLLILFNFLM